MDLGVLDFGSFGFLDFLMFGDLDFWNLGVLDCWIFGFWIFRPVDIWTPGTVFPCTAGARVGECHHIYLHIHSA